MHRVTLLGSCLLLAFFVSAGCTAFVQEQSYHDASVIYDRAMKIAHRGNREKALTLLDRYVYEEDSAAAYHVRAKYLLHQSDPEAAIDDVNAEIDCIAGNLQFSQQYDHLYNAYRLKAEALRELGLEHDATDVEKQMALISDQSWPPRPLGPVQGRGWTLFQVAIWSPIQLAPPGWSVYGARVNMPYGRNRNVGPFDVGVYNVVYGTMAGVQLGLLRNHVNRAAGAQLGSINNAARMTGLQVGVGNEAYTLRGMQLSPFWNASWDYMSGVQLGVIHNNATTDMRGVQVSLTNYSRKVRGVQFGLVNIAGRARGVQIGLINVINTHDFPWIPLINIGMDKDALQ